MSKKFYSQSLTYRMAILELLLKEEMVQSNIRNSIGISKQLLSYHLKNLVKEGMIEENGGGPFKIWKITQPGKKFLERYTKMYSRSDIPICRAENIRFKAAIIRMPQVPVDWKKIQMRNWAQYTSDVDQIKVKINTGKTPTIELLPSPMDGDDHSQLLVSLVYECFNVVRKLEETIGLKVGTLSMSNGTEWVVYDPLARIMTSNNQQVTYSNVAKLNSSKPRNVGEFEFNDPRAARNYLLMPQRLERIECMLERLLRIISEDANHFIKSPKLIAYSEEDLGLLKNEA